MSSDGYIFLLDASSQLFNKLMIITSHNMIKMGGVTQRELTGLVLEISGVINCFYLLENLQFLFGKCTCIWHFILAKFDQGHPKTALRSAVVISGWGIYMLIIAPRAFCIQKLESRNPDNIDKEVFFKFICHFKGHNTYWQIFKLNVSNMFLLKGVLRHNLTLKDEQKVQKPISLTKT